MLKTQLPFVDFYCNKEMLLELDETPRIDNYEDRHLSPSMEKFYSVLGVLFVGERNDGGHNRPQNAMVIGRAP